MKKQRGKPNWAKGKNVKRAASKSGEKRATRRRRDEAPPSGDVSAALLDLAAPILDMLGGSPSRETLEVVAADVALLWNIAVHEHLFGDETVADRFLEFCVPPGALPQLGDLFSWMLEAKRTERPFDARWIGNVHVVEDEQGGVALRAEWALPDALTREQAESVMAVLGEARAGPEPKRSTPRRRRTRSAPSVSPTSEEGELWRPLLEAARSIHALEPWELHLDRDVFGIRVEGEDEVHWCSVMGAGGEVCGVALYRGPGGFDVFRQISQGAAEEFGLSGFDGFLLFFVDREELSAAERRRIKEAGVRFRGRGAWPQIQRQLRGRLPADPTRADAERLRPILEALAEALDARCADGIPEEVDIEGELPVYENVQGRLAVRHESPGTVPEVALPPVDRVGVARVEASAVRADVALEFGGLALEARVEDEDGLEFIPFLFLAVDRTTGAVLSPRLTEIGLRETECASHLLAILAEAGVLPGEIRVDSEWIERAIAPTLEALSVKLVGRAEVPMFDEAAASFASFMGSQP